MHKTAMDEAREPAYGTREYFLDTHGHDLAPDLDALLTKAREDERTAFAAICAERAEASRAHSAQFHPSSREFNRWYTAMMEATIIGQKVRTRASHE
jgi:hypothetical protein